MGSAWVNDDVMTQERRNREWILGRLMLPAYDVDDALAGTVDANVITPDDVITSETTHYTAGATAGTCGLVWLNVSNVHSAVRHVALHVIPSGGSRDYTTAVFRRNMPGFSYARIGPIVLTAGATIRSISGDASANQIILRGEVLELEASPAGMTVTGAKVGATTTDAAIYTCPSVTHAIASIMIANGDSVARVVSAKIDRGGGGITALDHILAKTLASESALCSEWHSLNTGDVVYVFGEANSVVGARISVVEFA